MTADDVFRRVIGALDQAEIPYMLTGSFASAFHGIPRATQDIDLVIAPNADQLRALVQLLPPDEYYIDEQAALAAARQRTQFNIIDLATGWKVDLIIRRDRPFSLEEFQRRCEVDFAGLHLAVATAEDIVIAKLEWAKLGASKRQIEDVVGILRLRKPDLDLEYITKWVDQLGLQTQWDEARQVADL